MLTQFRGLFSVWDLDDVTLNQLLDQASLWIFSLRGVRAPLSPRLPGLSFPALSADEIHCTRVAKSPLLVLPVLGFRSTMD
jgi:hypothetical protein